MITRYFGVAFQWLRRVLSQPREELDRWQRAVRFTYDLGRFGAMQLKQDRAPQMAAALAFQALFGLVPVLIVATVLVRAVIGVDEFLKVIRQMFALGGLDQVKVILPAGDLESQTLADWLGNLVAEAAGIQLTAIGWLGLLVVIYAAVSLMFTIENVFNIIYRVNDGRRWTRRVPLYWFLLTVSPLALGLAAWLNGHFEAWLTDLEVWGWVVYSARLIWISFCGWVVMLTAYLLLPNAHVEFKPAAIGALVSIVLLECGKRVVGTTLENAFSISQLYGSLGLIPLFMFWTYLMWLTILFGLQVSATLQMLQGRRIAEVQRRREQTGIVEPTAAVEVMQIVSRRFRDGQSSTADQVSDAAALPRSATLALLQALTAAGVLHRLDQRTTAYTLARPAEQISADQLIKVGFAIVDQSGVRHTPFTRQLRETQLEYAANKTLADLAIHASNGE